MKRQKLTGVKRPCVSSETHSLRTTPIKVVSNSNINLAIKDNSMTKSIRLARPRFPVTEVRDLKPKILNHCVTTPVKLSKEIVKENNIHISQNQSIKNKNYCRKVTEVYTPAAAIGKVNSNAKCETDLIAQVLKGYCK